MYPNGDGQPTADNTLPWDWMVKIVGELRELFAGGEVFVAGDLLWYPTEGSLDRQAPDGLVAFGRPSGYRGSYKQWEEGNVAPQVVFEVLSPWCVPGRRWSRLKSYGAVQPPQRRRWSRSAWHARRWPPNCGRPGSTRTLPN